MTNNNNNSTSPLSQIFNDPQLISRLKQNLPSVLHIINKENMRGQKIGMEVGSARKWAIISLLVYKFGDENIDTNVPITESQFNIKVYDRPVIIKTITTESLGFIRRTDGKIYTTTGIKMLWTPDAIASKKTLDSYYEPISDILLLQIDFTHGQCTLALITKEMQREVFEKLGVDKYFIFPRRGSNARGVELSTTAMLSFIDHPDFQQIAMVWNVSQVEKQYRDYQAWQRWLPYWDGYGLDKWMGENNSR